MLENNNNTNDVNWIPFKKAYMLKLDKMEFNKRNIPFTKEEVESLPIGRTVTALFASREFMKQAKQNPEKFLHLLKQNILEKLQNKA